MTAGQAEGLFADLGAVRSGSTEFTTNFFATPPDAQAWFDQGTVTVLSSEGARLILRRDGSFSHVYHWAVSREALATSLREHRPALGKGTLTTDVIGMPGPVAAVESIYRESGFEPHQTLARMSRISATPVAGAAFGPDVRRAVPADVPRIDEFFTRLLDPFSEQLPTREELARLIEGNAILMVDRGPAVAGVLIFDLRAAAATLRYWWLSPEFRNQGIGAALIKAMFHEMRDVRRIQLWVVADNADAIAKYEHYGFRRDGLVDRILIRRGH